MDCLVRRWCGYFAGLLVFAIVAVPTTQAQVPVDHSTWTAESYPAVAGFDAGIWTVAGDNASVFQSINGQPTLFYSDFSAFGTQVEGVIRVSLPGEGCDPGFVDNDFIGFALGFLPDDTTSATADYLLIDWKQQTQSANFASPSCTPGTTAFSGLAVSRSSGVPTADEFWGHVDFSDPGDCPAADAGGLQELGRAINLGSTGWAYDTDYVFRFEFTPTSLKVFVNGALEIDLMGSFRDGRLAFYNFSQACVRYSAFTVLDVNPDIDIKPGSDPNCFNNNGHGSIPVAILGSNIFDVTQVDPSTVMLDGLAVRVRGKSSPGKYEDVNGDGFLDLVVHIEDVDNTFSQGDGVAVVTGQLFNGTPIEGSDSICITQ